MYKYLYNKYLLISTIFNLASSSLAILLVYYLQNVTDNILNDFINRRDILIVVLLIILLAIMEFFYSLCKDFYVEKQSEKIKNELVSKITSAKVIYVNNYNSGDIISRFNVDLKKMIDILSQLPILFTRPLIFLLALLYMLYISVKLSLLAIILIPIIFLVVAVLKKPLQVYSRKESEVKGEINTLYKDIIDGFIVMKSYSLKNVLLDNFNHKLDELFRRQQNIQKRKVIINPFFFIARVLPLIAVPILGGMLAINGEITVGQLFAFTQLISYVSMPIEYIFDFVVKLDETKPSINRLKELYSLESENYVLSPFITKPDREHSPVEINNLSYSYEIGNKVLDNICLSIGFNEKIAIVGESGCGKSTLLNILCGFLPNPQGEIYVMGNLIDENTIINIREIISYVPQKSRLYPTTIYQNIQYGNICANEEEIIHAAKQAGAHDFIMGMPEKYDTLILEGGRNLSGGQIQRIALARAILKPSDILILDEPTANLDLQSEELFISTINEIAKDRSVIYVTHRLNSIINFDKIYFLKDKVIAETETHTELLNNEAYCKLYERSRIDK